MKYVKKCPRCEGQIVKKEVKEILSGGINTAILNVKAGVCLHCGERLYSSEVIRSFEKIEAKLKNHETSDFQPLGKSFQVVL
ncbi:MAG: YgiT-type zinc finger protein [Cytophagales bacterium]|nr:YgiT-type zinc finger protein [Cytophagales bacterium]